VLIDVLHMLHRPDQDRLLAAIRDALEPEGLLIVREADASGGARFQLIRIGNWLRGVAEGQLSRRLDFDTAAGWDARLRAMGFVTTRARAGGAAPLANFLIYARPGPKRPGVEPQQPVS
jgi:hypothetical protein